jgi:hypothetical protein
MQPRKFECALCGWSGHPSFELVDDPKAPLGGKLVAKCGKQGCTFVDVTLTPADFNHGIAWDAAGVSTPVSTKDAPIAWEKPKPGQPRKTPAHPAASAPTLAAGNEPIDVIALMRVRRDYLEREVVKLEAAKRELRQLNRMIALADRDRPIVEAKAHAIMTMQAGDAQ